MDSGMVLEEAQRPPFDPLAPLLPEEVCWVLDRSISCEVSQRRRVTHLPANFQHRWSGTLGVLFPKRCIHFCTDTR